MSTQVQESSGMNGPIMFLAFVGGLAAEVYARLPNLLVMLVIGIVGKALDVCLKDWLARRRDGEVQQLRQKLRRAKRGGK